MKTSTASFGAAAVVLLAIFALWRSSQGRGNDMAFVTPEVAVSTPPSAVPLQIPDNDRSPIAAVDSTENATVQSTVSVREFLADYWGPRWNTIEQALLSHGMNLDMDYKYSPWEEAAPVIGQKLRLDDDERQFQVDFFLDWPKEENAESLQGKFPGLEIRTDAELQVIIDIAMPYNDELRQLGKLWVERLDLYIQQKWNQGDYVKAPFSTAGLQDDKGFYVTSQGSHGWVINLVLKEEDCPDMVELKEQSSALIERRDAGIWAYAKNR